MLLLGGIGSVIGPVIGAAVFFGIKVSFAALDYWRFVLGVLIILTCVVAPGGIAKAMLDIRLLLTRQRDGEAEV